MKRILVMSLAVVLLTGCVAQDPGQRPEPSTDSTDSTDLAASPDRPASAFDRGCDELAPIEDLRAIWGDALEPAPYNEAGAQGSWEMQATALIQDGALTCRWSLPGDDTRITVIALDDAVDGYDRTESAFLENGYVPATVGDGALTYCRTEGAAPRCHWNILSGDAWISLFFEDLATDELAAEAGARTDGTPVAEVAFAIIDSITDTPRVAVERVSGSLASCSDSLDQADVADALGVPIEKLSGSGGRPLESALGSSTPDFGQTMWAYSFERLGYSECYLDAGSVTGSVITAPGAAWILGDPTALQGETKEVEDLGRGTSDCRTEGGFAICTVAIAVGDDLALVSLGSEEPTQGIDLAMAVARLLIP